MAPTSAPLLAPHRKPRWTPTDQQKGILETVFAADSFPSFALRKQLAEQLANLYDARACLLRLARSASRFAARSTSRALEPRRPLPRMKGTLLLQKTPPHDLTCITAAVDTHHHFASKAHRICSVFRL